MKRRRGVNLLTLSTCLLPLLIMKRDSISFDATLIALFKFARTYFHYSRFLAITTLHNHYRYSTILVSIQQSVNFSSTEKRTALKRILRRAAIPAWPNFECPASRAKLRKEILMRLQCTLYLCISSRDLRANVNETRRLHEGMRGIRLSGRLLNRWIFCGLVNTQADKGGPPPRHRRYSR